MLVEDAEAMKFPQDDCVKVANAIILVAGDDYKKGLMILRDVSKSHSDSIILEFCRHTHHRSDFSSKKLANGGRKKPNTHHH